MKISSGSVVSFNYKLTEDGEIVEDGRMAENILYLHGYQNMLDGIESELEGKQVGDSVTITLSPEKAYGMRRENAIERVPMKYLSVKKPPKKGDVVSIGTSNGPRQAVVVKAGRFNVDVDTNHPLAGKTLTFDITIEQVREATADEIQHRHAHGDGGHHH